MRKTRGTRARISHIYHPTELFCFGRIGRRPPSSLPPPPPPPFPHSHFLCIFVLPSPPFPVFHIGRNRIVRILYKTSNIIVNADEDEDVASRTNRTSVMCENYFITVFVVTPAISLFLLCVTFFARRWRWLAVVGGDSSCFVCVFFFCLFICFNRIQFGQQFHLARCCSSIILARLRCVIAVAGRCHYRRRCIRRSILARSLSVDVCAICARLFTCVCCLVFGSQLFVFVSFSFLPLGFVFSLSLYPSSLSYLSICPPTCPLVFLCSPHFSSETILRCYFFALFLFW